MFSDVCVVTKCEPSCGSKFLSDELYRFRLSLAVSSYGIDDFTSLQMSYTFSDTTDFGLPKCRRQRERKEFRHDELGVHESRQKIKLEKGM